MCQFLYFIPGMPRNALPRQEVAATFAAVALRDVLRSDKTWNGQSITINPLMMDGPGGHQGTIFAALPGGAAIDDFHIGYRPTEQTWCQIGNAWLGWYTANPPTEQSLRKDRLISGYSVTLNDDCPWVAPIVRCQPVGSRVTLPLEVGLSETGQTTVRVMARYQHWQDLTAKLWEYKFGSLAMSNGELWDAAGQLLSLNYRIGPHEAKALSLFEQLAPDSEQSPNWWQIIDAAYDWPVIAEMMEASKKNESPPADSEQSAGSTVAT